jgi:ABC-2 type transport system permease protein
MALLGALFLAVGLFASALTENQIVAAFVGFGILLTIWLVAGLGSLLGDTTMGHLVSYISFMEHYDRLVNGLIDTSDLMYFASGLVLMLFLTHQVVDSARWK